MNLFYYYTILVYNKYVRGDIETGFYNFLYYYYNYDYDSDNFILSSTNDLNDNISLGIIYQK